MKSRRKTVNSVFEQFLYCCKTIVFFRNQKTVPLKSTGYITKQRPTRHDAFLAFTHFPQDCTILQQTDSHILQDRTLLQQPVSHILQDCTILQQTFSHTLQDCTSFSSHILQDCTILLQTVTPCRTARSFSRQSVTPCRTAHPLAVTLCKITQSFCRQPATFCRTAHPFRGQSCSHLQPTGLHDPFKDGTARQSHASAKAARVCRGTLNDSLIHLRLQTASATAVRK